MSKREQIRDFVKTLMFQRVLENMGRGIRPESAKTASLGKQGAVDEVDPEISALELLSPGRDSLEVYVGDTTRRISPFMANLVGGYQSEGERAEGDDTNPADVLEHVDEESLRSQVESGLEFAKDRFKQTINKKASSLDPEAKQFLLASLMNKLVDNLSSKVFFSSLMHRYRFKDRNDPGDDDLETLQTKDRTSSKASYFDAYFFVEFGHRRAAYTQLARKINTMAAKARRSRSIPSTNALRARVFGISENVPQFLHKMYGGEVEDRVETSYEEGSLGGSTESLGRAIQKQLQQGRRRAGASGAKFVALFDPKYGGFLRFFKKKLPSLEAMMDDPQFPIPVAAIDPQAYDENENLSGGKLNKNLQVLVPGPYTVAELHPRYLKVNLMRMSRMQGSGASLAHEILDDETGKRRVSLEAEKFIRYVVMKALGGSGWASRAIEEQAQSDSYQGRNTDPWGEGRGYDPADLLTTNRLGEDEGAEDDSEEEFLSFGEYQTTMERTIESQKRLALLDMQSLAKAGEVAPEAMTALLKAKLEGKVDLSGSHPGLDKALGALLGSFEKGRDTTRFDSFKESLLFGMESAPSIYDVEFSKFTGESEFLAELVKTKEFLAFLMENMAEDAGLVNFSNDRAYGNYVQAALGLFLENARVEYPGLASKYVATAMRYGTGKLIRSVTQVEDLIADYTQKSSATRELGQSLASLLDPKERDSSLYPQIVDQVREEVLDLLKKVSKPPQGLKTEELAQVESEEEEALEEELPGIDPEGYEQKSLADAIPDISHQDEGGSTRLNVVKRASAASVTGYIPRGAKETDDEVIEAAERLMRIRKYLPGILKSQWYLSKGGAGYLVKGSDKVEYEVLQVFIDPQGLLGPKGPFTDDGVLNDKSRALLGLLRGPNMEGADRDVLRRELHDTMEDRTEGLLEMYKLLSPVSKKLEGMQKASEHMQKNFDRFHAVLSQVDEPEEKFKELFLGFLDSLGASQEFRVAVYEKLKSLVESSPKSKTVRVLASIKLRAGDPVGVLGLASSSKRKEHTLGERKGNSILSDDQSAQKRRDAIKRALEEGSMVPGLGQMEALRLLIPSAGSFDTAKGEAEGALGIAEAWEYPLSWAQERLTKGTVTDLISLDLNNALNFGQGTSAFRKSLVKSTKATLWEAFSNERSRKKDPIVDSAFTAISKQMSNAVNNSLSNISDYSSFKRAWDMMGTQSVFGLSVPASVFLDKRETSEVKVEVEGEAAAGDIPSKGKAKPSDLFSMLPAEVRRSVVYEIVLSIGKAAAQAFSAVKVGGGPGSFADVDGVTLDWDGNGPWPLIISDKTESQSTATRALGRVSSGGTTLYRCLGDSARAALDQVVTLPMYRADIDYPSEGGLPFRGYGQIPLDQKKSSQEQQASYRESMERRKNAPIYCRWDGKAQRTSGQVKVRLGDLVGLESTEKKTVKGKARVAVAEGMSEDNSYTGLSTYRLTGLVLKPVDVAKFFPEKGSEKDSEE